MLKKELNEEQNNFLDNIGFHDNTAIVEISYPRLDDNKIKNIEVGLSDVRAADNIRISYDFDRDGWKIEQASIFSWDIEDTEMDPDWQEVAFVKAWEREKSHDRE